ncbi:unnamed protein product [Brassica rapa]|uniref:Uncharacterized protein n=1 Tax=Brassica campestris TaxID=3711 RepID=A0A8D9G8S9_BRACM|nr:unnamed protein product [Brassica rapa]
MICKGVCRTRKSNKQELKIYEIHSNLKLKDKSPEAEDRKRSVFFAFTLFFFIQKLFGDDLRTLWGSSLHSNHSGSPYVEPCLSYGIVILRVKTKTSPFSAPDKDKIY